MPQVLQLLATVNVATLKPLLKEMLDLCKAHAFIAND